MKIQIAPSKTQQTSVIHSLALLKKQREELDNRIVDVEKILMEHMLDKQQKSMSETDGGKKYTVTYVQARTTVINESSLRKAIGAATFDKYTTKKLDRKKLEAAIEKGAIDPVVVSMHAEERFSKPFLKFTDSTVDD